MNTETSIEMIGNKQTEKRLVPTIAIVLGVILLLVLAGLAAVDYVVPFSEDTPAKLIETVLPDVLVKGGDYRADEIVGGRAVLENGGEVRVLSFRDGHSTTRIIDRLKQ